jgi:type II secretory pathway pseudopilin PulG
MAGASIWELLITETIAALIGIFVGTLLALAVDRSNEHRHQQRRARVILRALTQELNENVTALSGGELADLVGDDLADSLSSQYALLIRIRYYVDLLTRLWLAPTDIAGYEEIRRGFIQTIVDSLTQTINNNGPLIDSLHQAT